jgi:hypothetical protein
VFEIQARVITNASWTLIAMKNMPRNRGPRSQIMIRMMLAMVMRNVDPVMWKHRSLVR